MSVLGGGWEQQQQIETGNHNKNINIAKTTTWKKAHRVASTWNFKTSEPFPPVKYMYITTLAPRKLYFLYDHTVYCVDATHIPLTI